MTRRPEFVDPDLGPAVRESRPVIGVDVGGTKVAAALVDEAGNAWHLQRRQTPHRSRHPRVVEDVIVDVVEELIDRAATAVAAVGIGAAGLVRAESGEVLFAPHLSWRDEPLQVALTDRLGLPVRVENDASAAAWAEYRFGAGRGEPHLVMVTLGTGIGGGVVLDGRLYRGRHGLAGEFGHMQVVVGGRRCECGNRGCWEQYASGNALVREAASVIDTGSPGVDTLTASAAANPEGLTGPLITQAAGQGDRVATELLADVGSWLGTGLAGLVAAFDPGLIVVGGGLGAAGEALLNPAREAFARHLTGRGFRPQVDIVPAELGGRAGLVGAAELARQALAGRSAEQSSEHPTG